MYTHVDIIFFTYRHDCGQEIVHVLTQSFPVDIFVQSKQSFEDSDRIFVPFLDVTVDKALSLNNDGID